MKIIIACLLWFILGGCVVYQAEKENYSATFVYNSKQQNFAKGFIVFPYKKELTENCVIMPASQETYTVDIQKAVYESMISTLPLNRKKPTEIVIYYDHQDDKLKLHESFGVFKQIKLGE